jgi:sec-independent protein translocase protein TatC
MAAPLRRRPRDPEGRMPLREHLRELRSRLFKAGVAVVLGAVAGWFLYPRVYEALQQPILQIRAERLRQNPTDVVTLSFDQVATSFNLQLRMSVYIGIVLSSPVWLYQLWAFIVPGLTKREKRYSMSFVGAAVPLFLAGIALAWKVLPNAIKFLTAFTPVGTANIINASDYFTFVLQIILAFGLAFVIPLLLVALNFAGVLSAIAMAKAWRAAVFLCFLFAAVASPTPDAGSMLALAFPMVGLYMLAVGIAWFNDRRRRRRGSGLTDVPGDLPDDEASALPPQGTFDPYASDDDASSGVDAGDRPSRP